MIKNKKAQLGDALTWIYKFLILVLVIGGIVAVVLNHYSKSFDVRDAESAVLAEKLVECIAPNSIVKEFSEASIRGCFPIDENELYLNISLDEDAIEIGSQILSTLCQAIEQKVKIKKYPVCHYSDYMVLNNGKLSRLSIFIAIKKIEKNL